MFALPFLFNLFAKDSQHVKLVKLAKQCQRHASLGFIRERQAKQRQSESGEFDLDKIFSCSVSQKEFSKEPLFTYHGVQAFKTEQIIKISPDILHNFNHVQSVPDYKYFDPDRLHFILEATLSSQDKINIDDITKDLTTTSVLTMGGISVDVLAWRSSQSMVTLLAAGAIKDYCTLGLEMATGHLMLPTCPLQVKRMYSVEYCPLPSKTGRPPNILVYTGDNEHQSCEKFQELKAVLGQCLDQDKYVIYQLRHDSIDSSPWQENIVLLILAANGQEMSPSLGNMFNDYVQNGGNLLSFGQQYNLDVAIRSSGVDKKDIKIHENLKSSVKLLPCLLESVFQINKEQNRVHILASTAETSEATIVSVFHGTGMAVLSLVDLIVGGQLDNASCELRNMLLKDVLRYLGLVCGEMKRSPLTKAYLLGHDKDKKSLLEKIEQYLAENCFKGNNIDVLFVSDEQKSEDVHPSQNLFPVLTFTAPDNVVSFLFDLYKDYLETKYLGQLVIYTEVITSTQTILNGCLRLIKKLPLMFHPVVLARQQTLGKGRGGNDWLSPDGCLSFSFPVQIDLHSHLGSRLPFLQHIAALAVVEAVRTLQGYEDLDFRIKWPNDIYFGNNTKIGGILVNSSIQGSAFVAVIGIGVNLDNSKPTTCINDVITQEKQLNHRHLETLSREQLLARIMNYMEGFLEDFQSNGPKNFLAKYHERWLHSNVKVKLENENGKEVTVRELDDLGFLSVVTDTNEVISLQPDSNSFDMMRNLIVVKTQR